MEDTTKKWEKVSGQRRGATVREGPIDVRVALEAAERGEDVYSLIGRQLSVDDLFRTAKKGKKKLKSPDEEYQHLQAPPVLEVSPERNQYIYHVDGEVLRVTPPRESELRGLFEGVRNMVFVATCARDVLDPRHKQQTKGAQYKPDLVTNLLTQVSFTKAFDVLTRVMMLPWTEFSAQEVAESWRWVQASLAYHVQSGPLLGLYKRLILNAGAQKVAHVDWNAYKERILRLLPFDASRAQSLAGLSLKDVKVELNLRSGSGYPFQQPKAEVVKQSYELACLVLRAIHEGKLQDLMRERPELFLVQLKNKLDLYEYAGTKDSVRPYFVFPYHLVWLFAAVWQNVSRCMVGFSDDVRTFNMHGFRWQRGGAQRLYDWILSVSDEDGLHCKAYSDDNLWVWVVRGPDGRRSVYILTPDYVKMDNSLHEDHGKMGYWYACEVLKSSLDATWKKVTELSCRMAFVTVVAIGHAIQVLMKHNLKSGVPGTPEFDQLASAHGALVFGDALKESTGALHERLAQASLVLEQRTGLKIKAGTLNLREFEPEQDSYAWTFLGKFLVAVPGVRPRVYVPCSDPVRALASMASPKSSLRGLALVAAQMTRVRDITVAGAFPHRQLYYGASQWFATMVQLGNRPKPTLEEKDDDDFAEDPLHHTVKYVGPQEKFPSLEECYAVYLPPGVAWKAAAKVQVVGAPTLQMDSAAVAQMYSDESSASWADQADAADRDRPDEKDKGGSVSVMARYQTVSPAQAGRLMPLSVEAKARFVERWRLATGRFRLRDQHPKVGKFDVKMTGKQLGFVESWLAAAEAERAVEESWEEPEESSRQDYPEYSYEAEDDEWSEGQYEAFEAAIAAEDHRARVPGSRKGAKLDRIYGRLTVDNDG